MIFNTWTYGLFLIATFCLYWLAPPRSRPLLLIGFGVFFYWYYHPIHTLLIAAMTAIVFGLAPLVQPSAGRHRRLVFVAGTVGCLGTLAYFKYQGFLFDSLAWVLGVA